MSPHDRYLADLGRAGFHDDPDQRLALGVFQDLHQRLLEPSPRPALWARLLRPPAAPVRGLYVWGGPGRGKTYLMDCFYETLPFAEKRRVHFHRLMLEIHASLGTLPKTPNPLPIVAERIAQQCRVLCLDEFHVSDVADAMLLGGLLEALCARLVTLVATSNTAPDDLYRDGLQRERFLPAIDLLKLHTRVHHLDGGRDFRLELLQESGTYRIADGVSDRSWLRAQLRELATVEPRWDTAIRFLGRDLQARAVADDIVWFDFEELCLKPRSARDYLEIAREFHTLLLHGVPHFNQEHDEAALRFMHLIDALYDHGVKCIIVADDLPERLYQCGRLEKPFGRTASRLTEMSRASYLARPHRPD
jgi:cell division protein ZapE